jgi:hypothetical protein
MFLHMIKMFDEMNDLSARQHQTVGGRSFVVQKPSRKFISS